MSIHSICGLMNSGKSLYMTYKLFLDYCMGRTIITNYDLVFPHIKINRDVLFDLGKSNPDLLEYFDCSRISMGFDELWIWLDCRSSNENRIATYLFLQSSKDDINIYITAQDHEQNERRIRRNVFKITMCSRMLLIDEHLHSVDSEKRFLGKSTEKLYIRAVHYMKKQIYVTSELVNTGSEYIKASPIIQLYNTRQKMRMKQ